MGVFVCEVCFEQETNYLPIGKSQSRFSDYIASRQFTVCPQKAPLFIPSHIFLGLRPVGRLTFRSIREIRE